MLWLLIILVSLISVFALVYPLLKSSPKETLDRLTINKQVYRDRIKELELEKEQLQLTDEEFKALESELKKNLLEDAHLLSVNKPSGADTRTAWTWISIGVIPVLAFALYFFIADWRGYLHWEDLIAKHQRYQNEPKAGGEWIDQLSKEELLLLLRTRLYNEPQDTRGWLILGQTLGSLGASSAAQSALTKALQTSPEDESLQLTVAQILTSLNNPAAIEQAERLVEGILKNNSNHEGALTIYGFIKARNGDFDNAIAIWQNLIDRRVARGEGEGKGVEVLKQQIEYAKSLAEQKKQKSQNSFSLTAKIRIADELKGRFPATTKVFVIVRGNDGIPAPVAVKPMMLADLPAEIELTDADAMMPGRLMSNMETIRVLARISFSGQAKPQSGDWQSDEVVIQTQDPDSIDLVISKEIP
jgi:cytochrome c-type biogenesis protein CcmI